MKQIERRLVTEKIDVRSEDGKPTVIAGYGAVFGAETVIAGMFRERIEPGAFRKAIVSADIRGTFNHSDDLILGRTTNGTLRLSEDERGLRYELDPNPDDQSAMDVVAKVRRGDVTGSSFGFRVADGGDTWTKPMRAGELPLRVISEFELIKDVGPVSFPAYDETTVEARSAARAAMTADPEAAEEAGEVIQFTAIQDLIGQVVALAGKMAPTVASLIEENGPASETPEAGEAEEELEQARYAVLMAQASQLCGIAGGLQSLIGNLRYGGYGYYSAAKTAELRREVDLLEVG